MLIKNFKEKDDNNKIVRFSEINKLRLEDSKKSILFLSLLLVVKIDKSNSEINSNATENIVRIVNKIKFLIKALSRILKNIIVRFKNLFTLILIFSKLMESNHLLYL